MFTNISTKETINHIHYCTNLRSKKANANLFEINFQKNIGKNCYLNNTFLKEVDGCTMAEPLSVTFSDTYMVKIEKDIVIPSKPIFYRRFADDTNSRRKIGDNALSNRLNKYHPNIKLTIELNASKSLDTKFTITNGSYKFNV